MYNIINYVICRYPNAWGIKDMIISIHFLELHVYIL